MKNILSKLDNTPHSSKIIYFYLLLWLIINLLQAGLTPLHSDEAYYWMYSKNPDWGFFDHPPCIALLIRAGYGIIPNELGVRLFPALMGTLTLWLIYTLIETENKKLSLFIMLTSSVILLQTHVCGFLALPDIPVVFFSALFLLLYRNYLVEDKAKWWILLGITGALMLYSKYHAVLVFIFILLSDIKITRRRSFWYIVTIIVVAVIPHLLWQINKDFPTFTYHLFSRSRPYKFDYTVNYFYSQVLIAGPLVGVIILYHSFKFRTSGRFERSMKFILVGFLLFFFFSSFRGRVEAHWTAIAYIPMLVLAYKGILTAKKANKWINFLFLPGIILFLIIRIHLVFPIIPDKWVHINEFKDWRSWADDIKQFAGDKKVVFYNSFQDPSRYSFYAGENAYVINNIYYRQNQYDIWQYEDSVRGEDILFIRARGAKDTLHTSIGLDYPYKFIDNFFSYNKIKISPLHKQYSFPSNALVRIPVLISNQYNIHVDFNEMAGAPAFTTYSLIHRGEFLHTRKFSAQDILHSLDPGEHIMETLKIMTPEKPGKYELMISIGTKHLYPAFNSRIIQLSIH